MKNIPYVYIDIYDIFKGPLTEVAQKILDLKNKLREQYNLFPNDFNELTIELNFDWDHDDIYFYLSTYRMETDEEYNIRIKKEEELKIKRKEAAKKANISKKKKQEENEKKLYEKLKNKYEQRI